MSDERDPKTPPEDADPEPIDGGAGDEPQPAPDAGADAPPDAGEDEGE